MQQYDASYLRHLKTSRILLVDDVAANIKVLECTLTADGYTNLVATTDSRKAVEHYQQVGSDLLILDLQMPHMDGFEVMAKLREHNPGPLAPILVLTAQHDQEVRLRALDEGARDYVTKPFERRELLMRVRNLLEVQLTHRLLREQNQLLELAVQQRTQELCDTQLEIVNRLGRAAEYRDNETGLHIIRMSMISALLGKAIGMSDGEVDMLLKASPMHDVGKIGIPDDILLKPGKLTADEWKTMQTHAAIGAEILSGHHSELLEMAREIALTHHEKWDGSGYPHGLQGRDIPLVGRIVALADVFDALTSKRPYKEAWTVEKAVALIKSSSGTHFDPALVESFLTVMPEIIRITEQYAEPDHADLLCG